MIDSVLKGTGNSRFLKSAVPAGTSWADALAMLQAGTFPIDFNGINTEGFQQVGTPMNKANLLKDATAAQIGLPPSTTPDGMFQALGNTGELHVWRKTVKNAADVPAGYTLGEVQNVTKYPITDVRSGGYTIVTKAYSNLSVDDAGNVSVDESSYVNFYNDASAVRGKFIRVHSDGDILFIPNDANISTDYETVGSAVIHNHYTDKYQSVTGYPLTPAGTTTTYPVSTNPNAYQEGDDAKAAGYVLGDVVTGTFQFSAGNNTSPSWYYSDGISVSNDGKITLQSSNYTTLYDGNSVSDASVLIGKFVMPVAQQTSPITPFVTGMVYFIPSNATFSKSGHLYLDRYQPVTGYAAIPAGTTIEYLGRLGDKARVQVVSYVGTGTYGSSNPNSLTFGNLPEAIIFLGMVDSSESVYSRFYTQDETRVLYPKIIRNGRSDVYGYGFGYSIYGKRDGNTISWYSSKNSDCQANIHGYTYYYLVLS